MRGRSTAPPVGSLRNRITVGDAEAQQSLLTHTGKLHIANGTGWDSILEQSVPCFLEADE
jgi:hypothetical protein